MTPDIARPRGSESIVSPFARLRALLGNTAPGGDIIDLTIGEPRHAMPEFVGEVLLAAIDDFAKYPPGAGTLSLRQAIASWIERRYPALGGTVDPESHILALNGSREGLFSAIFPAIDRRSFPGRPAVLMPNPFYHCYAGAAFAAGAEPIFMNAGRETGFLPDFRTIDEALLARTAVIYLCSPSNPQGAIARRPYLAHLISLAAAHDIMLFSDECYSEIYYSEPPPGALEVAHSAFGSFKNVLAFNSLSKRSNLPGLRSGFVGGDAAFIEDFGRFRNVVCPQIPLPVQKVSEAIWQHEPHVTASRRCYEEKLTSAKQIIGKSFDFIPPDGSFFLWLDVGDRGGGESAATTLWKECGVKVIPGAYLARPGLDGSNPGKNYIRVALVQDLATTERALERIVKTLG